MADGPEWDDQDSSDYADGREMGEGDARTGGSLTPAILLIEAACAWDALRRHAGADEGSFESRQIARDVMGILCARDRTGGCDTAEDGNG